jgi:hypothetical protein
MKFNPLYPPFGGNFRGALFNRTRLETKDESKKRGEKKME